MPAKLSDTQLAILTAACQREDRSVYPITARIGGAPLAKVLQSLLGKQLIEEVETADPTATWRTRDDGVALTVRATVAACEQIAVAPAERKGAKPARAKAAQKGGTKKAHTGTRSATQAKRTPKTAKGRSPARTPAVAPTRGKSREGTKQAEMIALLRRPEGATIDEIVAATGWQKHTVRGAISGALKKKLGLDVTSEKVEGRGRVYRIGK
jgi:hypothetical protein